MKALQEKDLKVKQPKLKVINWNPELGSLLLACSSGTFHDAELPVRIQPSCAPATTCVCLTQLRLPNSLLSSHPRLPLSSSPHDVTVSFSKTEITLVPVFSHNVE